jgi:large repetitive protein
MRLYPRAASLLPLLLLVLLPPVRGEAAPEYEPRLACAPAPARVTNFASGGSLVSSLAAVGDTLFFASYEPAGGAGLWKADHSSGTVVTTKLRSWPGSVSLARLTAADGLLYFVVNEGIRTALWSSDGTSENTSSLAVFDSTALLTDRFAVLGRTLFFMGAHPATGHELWRSDGTVAGTRLVKDINPGAGDSFPLELTVLNGRVFFQAYDNASGSELWVSDGVPDGPGTYRVKDIRPGPLDSSPSSLRVMGGKLFFTATTGGQAELWSSDGTEAGTQVAVSAALGANHTSLEELTVMGDTLFFHMDDQSGRGEELWRSDGTEAGTWIVKELQVGMGSSSPQNLMVVGGTLFFMASDGLTGRELWKTDGTEAGTVLVKDFVSGSSNPPGGEILAPGPGVLLVAINDNRAGQELWKVNRMGAEQLTDIISGIDSSNPHGMTVAGNRLYFVATYPGVGEELAVLPLNQVDCVPPQPECPAPLSVEAVSPVGAFLFLPSPKALWDDSLTPLTVEYSAPTPGIFPLADTHVLITVRDAAFNTAQCSLKVTVEDTTPPALVCPRRLLQEATGMEGANVSFPVKALDAVTAVPSVSYSRASGSLFRLGQEEEIQATATDANGNTSTCRFSVLVKDTVPPSIVCPPAVVRVATSAEPVPITYPPPQVQDTVGVVEVRASHESGSLFNVGETKVTLTAVDAANNPADCTFTVYNQDVVAPSITCPGPQQVVATQDEGAAVLFPDATAADDLAPPTVLYSHEPGSTFPVGETIVTATARDRGGNEVSCSFPVTVVERSGCGCQSGSASASVFWLVLALMPLWVRRRASRLGR